MQHPLNLWTQNPLIPEQLMGLVFRGTYFEEHCLRATIEFHKWLISIFFLFSFFQGASQQPQDTAEHPIPRRPCPGQLDPRLVLTGTQGDVATSTNEGHLLGGKCNRKSPGRTRELFWLLVPLHTVDHVLLTTTLVSRRSTKVLVEIWVTNRIRWLDIGFA